jgi:hypothetical protein
LQQRSGSADAGIVDERSNTRSRAEKVLDTTDILAAVEISHDYLDGASGLGFETGGEGLEPFAIACDENKIIALLGEAVGIDCADAGGSTGDNGGARDGRDGPRSDSRRPA